MAKYKVLVVDDSPFMRKVFGDFIASDPDFAVVGTAGNGREAIERALELQPDVITMDLEMPVMNGLEALQQLMAARPTPTIMISAVTDNGTRDTIRALQYGALDFIRKPGGSVKLDIGNVGEQLKEKLRMVAELAASGGFRPLPAIEEPPLVSAPEPAPDTGQAPAAGPPEAGQAPAAAPPEPAIGPEPGTGGSREAPAPASGPARRQPPQPPLPPSRREKPAGRAKPAGAPAPGASGRPAPKPLLGPAGQAAGPHGAAVAPADASATPVRRAAAAPAPEAAGRAKRPPAEPAPAAAKPGDAPPGSTAFDRLVAIGTSTGGPRALHEVLTGIPADFPAPILIVQHMPPKFTNSLAQRLDSFAQIRVCEARDGELIRAGTAYIAPGGRHMTLAKASATEYKIALTDEEPRSGHRPSVDRLFESLIGHTELKRYAVLMTGMGSDGAKGMRALLDDGAEMTIAEAEDSCIVYGMPRSAVELGAAKQVVPLQRIARALVHEVSGR